MKAKICRCDWDKLLKLSAEVRIGKYDRQVQKVLMDGLADAIDAEFTKREMHGDNFHGIYMISADLILEPYQHLEYEPSKRRNILSELDQVLADAQRELRK